VLSCPWSSRRTPGLRCAAGHAVSRALLSDFVPPQTGLSSRYRTCAFGVLFPVEFKRLATGRLYCLRLACYPLTVGRIAQCRSLACL
jgi:hypothetical protein